MIALLDFFPRKTAASAACCILMLSLGSSRAEAEESAPLSKTWQQFVAAKHDGTEPILPDFSFAGYHGGADPIPEIKGPIFDVTQFGAKGDGIADDQEAIQKAINAAQAAGGGVVFFPRGTFRVNCDIAHRRPIIVRQGHIVLRGSGASKGGTVILIEEPTIALKAPTADSESGGGEMAPDWMFQIQPIGSGNGKLLAKVIGDTRRETSVLTLDNGSQIHPGMWITLTAKGQALVPDVIAPYKESDMPSEWARMHEGQIGLQEHHLVTAVQGNRITLREPVKTGIKASQGWSVVAYANIAEIGVEDICFEGAWLGKFVHHRSRMDDAGWAALKFFNVVDSWVRRCAFINFNATIGAESCAYTSVIQIVLAGTMGHVSIDAHRRSTGMLYGLMQDRLEHQPGFRDTTHGIGAAGSAVATVFWRYSMQLDEAFDMHGNFPYATLFDAVDGGNFAGSGGPVQSFPGHLQHFVAWNFNQRKVPEIHGKPLKVYNFWGGRPSLVMPMLIGMHGMTLPVDEKTVAMNESPGRPVQPESLYEAQLALRFNGQAPAWVAQAKVDWAKLNTNLPDFPRSGDNTPWVAKKRLEIIQGILDTPMLKEKGKPREGLLQEWPTSDGKPWVAPAL